VCVCVFFYVSAFCIVIFRNVTPLLNEDCLNTGGMIICGIAAYSQESVGCFKDRQGNVIIS
jgi:tellurite resistance protein TehA-like permease